MIALLLLQAAAPAAAPAAPPPSPQRFSILADPCGRAMQEGRDIVVCGRDPTTTQRLPYPNAIVPDGPVASNPNLDGVGVFAVEPTPCAATQWGCQVGIGPPLGLIANGLVSAIRHDSARRRETRARAADGNRRQPVDLSAPGPAGRLEP